MGSGWGLDEISVSEDGEEFLNIVIGKSTQVVVASVYPHMMGYIRLTAVRNFMVNSRTFSTFLSPSTEKVRAYFVRHSMIYVRRSQSHN